MKIFDKKIKLVIFDQDLTLIDTRKQVFKCFEEAFKKYGLQPPNQELSDQQIGISLKKTFSNIASALGYELNEETITQLENEYINHAKVIQAEHITPCPGAIDILEDMNKKVEMGLLTSKPRWLVEQILNKFGWSHFFNQNLMITEFDAKNKPDPEGLLKIVERSGLPSEQIVYIGDSYVDAITARDARVPFIGVTTGTTSESKLREYPHLGIFKNLVEFRQFITPSLTAAQTDFFAHSAANPVTASAANSEMNLETGASKESIIKTSPSQF